MVVVSSVAQFWAILQGKAIPSEGIAPKLDPTKLQTRGLGILAELNPRYRRAIELRFLQGLSRADCAQALQTSEATVDVVILRAVRSFRVKWMASYGEKPHVA